MILNSETFLKEVKIESFVDDWQVNGVSLDLRIGTILYLPDMKAEEDIGTNGVIIHRREHFLIQTLEKVTLPNNIVGIVYPRSSTNRKGITIDQTGIVDPGYSGYLILPITNLSGAPIQFHAGERIAQIVFERCEPVEVRESKYHNSGIAAKPDKEEEMKVLIDGSLFASKIERRKETR